MSEPSNKPASTPEPISITSQPHEDNSLQQRRTRRSLSPDNDTTPSILHHKPIPHAEHNLPISLETSRAHRSASQSRELLTMASSDSSPLSGLASPKFTRTGRVSKAKKGLRGAHVCTCGKVSSSIYLRRSRSLPSARISSTRAVPPLVLSGLKSSFILY